MVERVFTRDIAEYQGMENNQEARKIPTKSPNTKQNMLIKEKKKMKVTNPTN